MDTEKPRSNRVLLIVLVVLYLLTLAAFNYVNWAADPEFMQWWMPLVNSLLLSIPLLLLYGSIYVLVVAWREHKALGQVSPRLAKLIHWAPRIWPLWSSECCSPWLLCVRPAICPICCSSYFLSCSLPVYSMPAGAGQTHNNHDQSTAPCPPA